MALPPQPAAQDAARKRLRSPENLSAPEHLLALREAAGLTQAALGLLLGSQGPNVCVWESVDGQKAKRPVLATAHKIEAWSRGVVRQFRLPSAAVLLTTKWCTDEERQQIQHLASGRPVSP